MRETVKGLVKEVDGCANELLGRNLTIKKLGTKKELEKITGINIQTHTD